MPVLDSGDFVNVSLRNKPLASSVGVTPTATTAAGPAATSTATAAITTTLASTTSGSSLSSRVGSLIAQYKTDTEDGQFASFLAYFKRVLN